MMCKKTYLYFILSTYCKHKYMLIDLALWILFSLPGSTTKIDGLLYLELLCQLAAEAIKHGQVKGTKVRIEAERGGEKKKSVSEWLFMQPATVSGEVSLDGISYLILKE